MFGSSAGVTTAGSQLWHQDIGGIGAGSESGDRFGQSAHMGDFNGDGHAGGVVVGVPFEELTTFGTGKIRAGLVHVLPGDDDGLTSVGSRLWHQARPGVTGGVESLDRFGSAIGS